MLPCGRCESSRSPPCRTRQPPPTADPGLERDVEVYVFIVGESSDADCAASDCAELPSSRVTCLGSPTPSSRAAGQERAGPRRLLRHHHEILPQVDSGIRAGTAVPVLDLGPRRELSARAQFTIDSGMSVSLADPALAVAARHEHQGPLRQYLPKGIDLPLGPHQEPRYPGRAQQRAQKILNRRTLAEALPTATVTPASRLQGALRIQQE